MGMGGAIFDWLRMLYDRMVRHEGMQSAKFKAFIGLLTGDPASPILWNLFLVDLSMMPDFDDVNPTLSAEPSATASESSAAEENDDELDVIPDPAHLEASDGTTGLDNPGESPQEFHARLNCANRSEFSAFYLKALKRYNGIRLGHAQKLLRLQWEISESPPRLAVRCV
ncbi:hypothetical protein B0H13DRAFT_2319462 [Mycena leptocephala]|nr:hypothetical protein B0H13DRAFT_2319462 [Mycena leptocephala]